MSISYLNAVTLPISPNFDLQKFRNSIFNKRIKT